MPRTEKRFGVVNQPASTAVEELVPSAATTRNLLINATARSAAVIAAAIYSGAYSNDTTGSVSLAPSTALISMSNASAIAGGNTPTALFRFGRGSSWNNVFAWGSGSDTSGFAAVDQSTGSYRYTTETFSTHNEDNHWRNSFDREIGFKAANSGSGNSAAESAKLNNCFVAVSDTKAIGIAAGLTTSATGDLFDSSTISHTVGTSFSETAGGIGQTSLQGTGNSGKQLTIQL